MLPESSIIIIDNDESELNQLSKAFSMSGIPCLPLLYNSRNGVESYNLKPSINIRWLFIDLNLEDSTENTAAAFIGPIKSVINKLVCGGIYTLVFWSKHSNIINEIIERIKQDENLKKEIHCPIMIHSLDKTSLTQENDLRDKIKEILKSPEIIKSIYSWEKLVTDSVSRVLGKTYKLANINNSWDKLISTGTDDDNNWKDETTISNIENIVSLLAYESTGFKSAPEIKERSFNNGLFSLVENEYDNISDNLTWGKSTLVEYKKIDLERKIKLELNTYLSFDEVDLSSNIKIMFNKGILTFINDRENFFKKILGNNNCINEEFSENSKGFSDDDLKKIIIGALEISPDCDHANKKIKLPRFLLSVLIPDTLSIPISKKYHDGVFSDLPLIIYNDTNYKLLVSYKYLFSIHDETDNLNTLFSKQGIRIKQSILSKIRLEMSRHISRFGYISIH